MSSLEAIVIDYVKLYDQLQAAKLKPAQANSYEEHIGAEREVGRLGNEVEGMLAALRSHARAVYDIKR